MDGAESIRIMLRTTAICSGKIVKPIQQICLTGKSSKSLSIPSDKNILLFRNSKSPYHPVPPKGAIRDRHVRGAGCGGR
jgi:hypothetical protein